MRRPSGDFATTTADPRLRRVFGCNGQHARFGAPRAHRLIIDELEPLDFATAAACTARSSASESDDQKPSQRSPSVEVGQQRRSRRVFERLRAERRS